MAQNKQLQMDIVPQKHASHLAAPVYNGAHKQKSCLFGGIFPEQNDQLQQTNGTHLEDHPI